MLFGAKGEVAAAAAGYRLFTWGRGDNGGLGISNVSDHSSPVQVGSANWHSCAIGHTIGLAVDTDGYLSAWGYNTQGTLGQGDTDHRSSPVQVGSLTNWKGQISSGFFHALMIKDDGTLWGMGRGDEGQLGDGTTADKSSPVQVGALSTWSKLFIGGGNSSFAIKTDGTLWSWGQNDLGQLGQGNTTALSSPVQVGSATNWTKVCGYSHMVAINEDGEAWSCGKNDHGQLGQGNTTDLSTLTQIGVRTDWANVTCDFYKTIAVMTTGKIYSFGHGAQGALGLGNTTAYSSPVQIGSLTDWSFGLSSFTGGGGIKTDGSRWGWGRGDEGETGQGNVTDLSSPVQIGSGLDWLQRQHTQAIYTMGGLRSSVTEVVDTGHQLFAWGVNTGADYAGSLGDGTTVNQSSPIQIGQRATWASISASVRGWLSLKSDGTLWGNGDNDVGQLGNGATADISSPVQVGSLNTWRFASRSVGGGNANSMGVTSAGKLYTWGDNSNGALGQGNTTDLSVPTQVGALTDWSHGAAGDGFSLLIKTDGTLWTFGKNSSGQLGHGNTTVNSSPIQVGALATWTAIRAIGGGAVIGLTSDGKLWGWGSGGNGRTGHGNTTNYSAPVQIGIATDWTAIGTTNGGGGAVNSSGKLYTWGAASAGRLGNGTSTPDISTPTQVGALTDWGTLSSNSTTMHSVKSDGTLWGWGGGGAGDLGDGTTVSKSSPVQIGVDTTWKSMDDSLGHNSPRIKTAPTKFQVSGVDVTDGTLFNWGFGESGQIGDGTAVGKSSPVQVGSRSDWASLSMSNSGRGGHGLKSDGTLWAWGDGVNGALGLGNTTDYSSPVQVGSLNTWRAIFGGHTPQTFIGVSSSGTLWTCGYNAVGEMGDSSTVAKSSPVQVGALTDWSHGSIDGRVALAIKTDGTMWSWGFNYKGALGVGDTANRSSPTQIGALTTWSKVTAGSYGGLAIKTDGTLWGWGYNRFGWLGTGNTTDYSSPVQIGAQTDWADIGMGRGYTPMGIKTTGKLYTWGRGTSGELGDGTTVSKSSPVQVGALTDWASAGANRSMQATKTDGTLWAWGDGNSGETGLGNTTNYSSPVQVGSSVQWKPFDHSLGHVNGGIIL